MSLFAIDLSETEEQEEEEEVGNIFSAVVERTYSLKKYIVVEIVAIVLCFHSLEFNQGCH